MKKICLIVAYGTNGVIGDGISLPAWRLKDDMAHFKETTMGNSVIMGRKNWDSIPKKFRPLSDRTNIVITRNPFFNPDIDEVKVAHSLWKALDVAEETPGDKIFIIGGREVYHLVLEKIVIDEFHITTVDGDFEGTVKFPIFNGKNDYLLSSEQKFEKNDRNSHSFVIKKFVRKRT